MKTTIETENARVRCICRKKKHGMMDWKAERRNNQIEISKMQLRRLQNQILIVSISPKD